MHSLMRVLHKTLMYVRKFHRLKDFGQVEHTNRRNRRWQNKSVFTANVKPVYKKHAKKCAHFAPEMRKFFLKIEFKFGILIAAVNFQMPI